jgi:hypothetical protein
MIARNIKERARDHGHKKGEILRGQISAGNDHLYITKAFRVKMFPDKLALNVGYNQNLHGLLLQQSVTNFSIAETSTKSKIVLPIIL